MIDKPIQIIGLKRTGTSYLSSVLKQLDFITDSYVQYYKFNPTYKAKMDTVFRVLYQHVSKPNTKEIFSEFNNICLIRTNIFEVCLSLLLAQHRGYFHSNEIYVDKVILDKNTFITIMEQYHEWYNIYLDDIINKIIIPYKIIIYEELTFNIENDLKILGLNDMTNSDFNIQTVKNLPKSQNIKNINELQKLFNEFNFEKIYNKIDEVKLNYKGIMCKNIKP